MFKGIKIRQQQKLPVNVHVSEAVGNETVVQEKKKRNGYNMNIHLLTSLKGYFKNKESSDKTFRVVEEGDIASLLMNLKISEKPASLPEGYFKMGLGTSLESLPFYTVQQSPDTISQNKVNKEDGTGCIAEQGNINDTNSVLEVPREEMQPDDKTTKDVGDESKVVLIPFHSILLCVNSTYFKMLIQDSNMKENKEDEITIKVNKGQGRYFEILIHSFYDPSVLSNLCISEMLHVLQFADMFLCNTVIEAILELLECASIASLGECNDMIAFFQHFRQLGPINTSKMYGIIEKSSADFLANAFHGLEYNLEYHETFTQMLHASFLVLLSSEIPFLYHENNLIYFVKLWLTTNEDKMTDDNIRTLIEQCCYEKMSPEYLTGALYRNDEIFSRWKGWNEWCYKAISYHAVSRNTYIVDVLSKRKGHVIPRNIQNCEVKMIYEDGVFKPEARGRILYQGVVLSPELRYKECGSGIYDVTLHVNFPSLRQSYWHFFHIQCTFAFTIFPVKRSDHPSSFSEMCGNLDKSGGNYSASSLNPQTASFLPRTVVKSNLFSRWSADYGRNDIVLSKVIKEVTFAACTIGEHLLESYMESGIHLVLEFF